LVRVTRFLPGVARTAEQIERYADHWRRLALDALAADGPVLVVLGDSLAQGIGASDPDHGYVGGLRRHLRVGSMPPPVLNLSRSGATIDDVTQVQLPALAASGVTGAVVVCTVGSNDLVRSVRLTRTRRSLAGLLDAVPAGTVMATLPARGSLAAKVVNRRLRVEAGQRGLVVADVNAHLRTWRGHQAADRFHPNDAGYRCWVDAFVAVLGDRTTTSLTSPVDATGSAPAKGR
jgi:lysophospholipase L1-like esterase